MRYLLLSLLIITINLSLYAQTKRFENNLEPNMPYSKNMEIGNSIDYRLSHFDNPTDDLNFWPKDQQFILKTTNVVDSVIIAGQKPNIMGIGGSGKQTYTYDNNGKIILMLQEYWDDTVWTKHKRKIYTYDSKGNMTMESLGIVWSDTSWLSLKDYNTYNEDGLLVLRYSSCIETIYNPDGHPRSITMAVDSCRRNTYTYDSNGNMILNLYERQFSDSTWREQRRVTYTYDSDGNMTLMLYEMFRSPNSRTIYTYNSNGNITSKLYEMWRSDSTWQNSGRTTYTYNSNGNMNSMLDEKWDYRSTWQNSDRTTYTYDSNGDMTLILHEKWGFYSTWENSDRTTYAYNNNGDMTLMLHELWINSTWVYRSSPDHGVGSFSFQDALGNNYSYSGTKAEIFYKEVTDVDENDNNNLLHYTLTQNYPNPFNPTTVISYSLPQSGLVQLKIYDVLGREVVVLLNKEQPKGNHKVVFNATNLTSGVYFYNFKSGNYTETKKLILLR